MHIGIHGRELAGVASGNTPSAAGAEGADHHLAAVWIQETKKLRFQLVLVFGLALPNDHDCPAESAERAEVGAVTGIVFLKLCDSIVQVAQKHARLAASLVAVPETAVDHDCATRAWKDAIRLPGKVFCLKPA